MSAVTDKLKDKSGVSLAIALVFFLLCAMVGTVVLSAASVSAGKTARERLAYRQTLAMSSAAELLGREIRGLSFTGAYTRTETVTTTVPDGTEGSKTTVKTELSYAEGKGDKAPRLTGSQLFEGHLSLDELYFGNQEDLNLTGAVVIPEPVKLDLTFQESEGQNIPEVTAQLTVEADYRLTVVLSCGENWMVLTFSPSLSTAAQTEEPMVSGSEKQSVKTTVTTYTTVITWENPQIREGGTP